MRKSTKEIKPSYIVNVDDIETLGEIDAVFALAKHNAGLAITDKELTDIIKFTLDEFGPKITVVSIGEIIPKKKPWYKRFWNWVTRKNK